MKKKQSKWGSALLDTINVNIKMPEVYDDRLIEIAKKHGTGTRTATILFIINKEWLALEGNSNENGPGPGNKYVKMTPEERGRATAERKLAEKKRKEEIFTEEKLAICEHLDGRYNEMDGTCTFNFYDKQMNMIVRSEQRLSLPLLNDAIITRAFGPDGKEKMIELYNEKKEEGLVKDL